MKSPQRTLPDVDPDETREWADSLEAVANAAGPQRAQFLMFELLERARELGLGMPESVSTWPVNTIGPDEEVAFPGDEEMERRIQDLVRWNAAVMVSHANKRFDGLGGHISTYASSASLYEVGFNHFFRGPDHPGGGDLVYYQGHAAPGIYARAYLEGRLTESQLEHFRRESRGGGLSSYPHPRLMPDFWEFPTVSMGLGPMNALYQARFLRYLQNRGICDTSERRVWCFIGDGETDEPETLGALTLAAREHLDNLIFIVNCNLQRLDGPVRGNGHIVKELEMRFRGSGWEVIKVLLAREWDELLARDTDGRLVKRLAEIRDGDWQRYSTESGATLREEIFGGDPALEQIVEHLSDDDLDALRPGGHDRAKLFPAYRRAAERLDRPAVILAQTVKGFGLGEGFEARNVTHQMKKFDQDELREFRDRLGLDIADDRLEEAPYYRPAEDSEVLEYLRERRRELGGSIPRRRTQAFGFDLPATDHYDAFRADTGKTSASTTTAFVRLLRSLMKDKAIGDRVVPIIPDEARTFGMEGLFREFKIYASEGQQYKPVDHDVLLSYTEAADGQILEEGITEAGSMASFTAAAISHSAVGEPMIPFYIFYSMFGFQRVGDSIWSLADNRGRGFLLGATYGRTTLNGEGLQHQDGHSLLVASTVPNCLAYDPAFHYEIATIVEAGLKRMFEDEDDIFYYLTLYNEAHPMPAMPEGARDGILRGLYPLRSAPEVEGAEAPRAVLFGSGVIMHEVLRAQAMLAERYGVAADVYSATSYGELARDCAHVERRNLLSPDGEPRTSYLQSVLQSMPEGAPIVAASDSIRAVPGQIAHWVDRAFTRLGTDGFGRSDTREALRSYFEIDAEHIVYATLATLGQMGRVDLDTVTQAREELGIDSDGLDPARTDEIKPPSAPPPQS